MDLSSKITAGLSRLSEVFKALLWEQAKTLKLSPIQIQLLNFIAFHQDNLCNVSSLAREFNLTKPTISDAIRVLVEKKLLIKDFSSPDSRSYTLQLSSLGKETVDQTISFSNPVKEQLVKLDAAEQEQLYLSLSQLIYQLNRTGVLSVQRICFGCKFYQKTTSGHYCNFLKEELMNSDIRLDCPEFESKT